MLSEQVRLPLPGRVGHVGSVPGVRRKRSPLAKLPRAPLGRKEISHATKGQWHGRPAREEPVRERSKSVMAGTAMPRRITGGERKRTPG